VRAGGSGKRIGGNTDAAPGADPTLQRVLTSYVEHYNGARPHRGIGLDVPVPAPVTTVTTLPVVKRVERVDVLGGLIHEYRRAA